MTELEWRNVDDVFIETMNRMDQHELVRLLWDGDDNAWRYIYARAVVPMLRRPSLGQIVSDRQRSDLDVCGAVYEYLIAKRKLDQYGFGCPLIYWVRYWVLKDVLGYCAKNDIPVSDDEAQSVLLNVVAPEADIAAREEAAWCFGRLCQEDRKKARVLYLKEVEGRTAREIMRIMNISSEANVHQLHSRACAMMREFREKCRAVHSVGKERV